MKILARIAALVIGSCLSSQAFAAATLLPPAETCFSAGAPTSGGVLGPVFLLGSVSGGSGYANGVYTNVPLTGGSGFGAQATITVTGNTVSSVAVTNPGSHYAAGDGLSATAASIGGSGSGFSVPVSIVSTTGTGMVGLLGTITGGSGGTNGTYGGVALISGSGSGATANITVSGGAVTAVQILNPGKQYVVGDTLSANSASIGNVSGFSVPISSVMINGSLAGGQVYFYAPGTSSFKSTWFNAAATSQYQNTNPVQLDANGCAVIYGTGTYRQVLQDAMGNTVWDQLTTDTSANNSYFWAGNALNSGTANAIQVADSGFNGTDGSQVGFTAIATNTGSTTITLVGTSYTNIPIKKDTTTGPVSLIGGEIVQNNPVTVVFRASDNAFHILNPVQNTAPSAGFFTSLVFTGSVTIPVRTAVSNSDNISATKDYFVCADNTSSAATENLPASPATGLTFVIKDCSGFAASNSITIQPASGNIDGSASFVMGTAYQSIGVTYTGSQWSLN